MNFQNKTRKSKKKSKEMTFIEHREYPYMQISPPTTPSLKSNPNFPQIGEESLFDLGERNIRRESFFHSTSRLQSKRTWHF